MNNEIKEILDKLKDDGWYDELDLTGEKWIELNQTETKQILDYITNLQQDTEMYAQLKDEYEEEIKELHENNQNMQEEMARVWEENERLNLELSGYREAILRDDKLLGLQDYKSRCEKANELLKYYDPEPWSTYQITGETLLNLLNILQGENDATNKDL